MDSSDPAVRNLALTAQAYRLIASGAVSEGTRLFDEVIATFASLPDRYNQASAHLNRARLLYDMGDRTAALHDAAEARSLAVTIAHGALQVECDEFFLHVGCDDDDEDAVNDALKDIIPAWSRQRKALRNDRDRVGFADSIAPITDKSVAFFLKHGKKAQAFAMMELGRAQALSDLMAESLAEAPAIGGSRDAGAPVGVDDARAVLRELGNTALFVNLTYVGDELTAMLVRQSVEEPLVISTGFTRQQIGVLLQDFNHDMLQLRGQGAMIWQIAADKLVRSFERHIEPDALVIFLIEEDLQILPLSGAVLTSGKYLVEHAAVGYAPSVTVLRDLAARRSRARQRGLQQLLAVGIAFPDEALVINQIIGGIALTGNRLKKSDIEQTAKDSSIVHFACHGHFDAKLPAYSGLHLRSPSTTLLNDILSVQDLAQWRLSADLVTLSACETGRGKVAVTEFLGLTRNLLATSTNAVVATLWPVQNQPTRNFMLAFYSELRRMREETQVARVVEALCKVQRQFCRKADFYDWAAFKVVGWPDFQFDKETGGEKGNER
ncbi:CHAT domain-containing protein [Rhizobium laguerreae]|uniref:CHAT domain-containing protein n=1 Tax=Rhizobium laguerreae TaxID=1076926 RepID=UPI00300DB078